MHIAWYIDILLMLIAFFAAVIDTLAGGGGLITVPALLITGINPIVTLGTIKLQASVAELSAAIYFLRKGKINYKTLTILILYTVIFSIFGVICLKLVPVSHLEKLIPFLLLTILIYYITTLKRKYHAEDQVITPNQKKFFLLGSLIGFYNGFFGPGTGSIWAVALMKSFKLNVKRATMYAKPLNFAGNLAAMMVFIYNKDINFSLAILMAIGAYFGSQVGGRIVLYKDLRILKLVFLIIMTVSVIATFIRFYL